MDPLSENMLVSAIICSYNGNNRIQRAIRSVLEQSYENLELIIVDDGSENSLAPEILAFHDKRIRLFRFKKNKGLHAARKFAVEQAEGEFIALLDDDDYWLPEKIEKQMAIIQKNAKFGLICTAATDIFPDGRKLTRYPPSTKIIYRQEAVYECTIASSVLFRKSAYECVGGFDDSLLRCGDWECWIRLAKHYEIRALMESLVVTCMRDRSLQRSGDVTAFGNDRFIVLKKHEAALKSERIWNAALSWQYHSVGVRFLRAKQFNDARKLFAKAVLKNPQIVFFLHYVIAWPLVGRLYPVIRVLGRNFKQWWRLGKIK